MIPGEYQLASNDIEANKGRKTLNLDVVNQGDRPIQVGSHFHFYETNEALQFDRSLTKGMRLNIPSGNAVRFEPGESKSIELTDFGGNRIIMGFHNKVNAPIQDNPSDSSEK